MTFATCELIWLKQLLKELQFGDSDLSLSMMKSTQTSHGSPLTLQLKFGLQMDYKASETKDEMIEYDV